MKTTVEPSARTTTGDAVGTPIRRHEWRSRRMLLPAVVIILIVVVGVIVIASARDDGRSVDSVTRDDAALELSLGTGDGLASCLAFEVAVLADMSPAFAATVSSVDDETVVLTVDRWYAGDAGTDLVELHAPSGLEALIGGFPFVQGQQYLITAANGSVNYCGYSGPATPELTTAFNQAFAA